MCFSHFTPVDCNSQTHPRILAISADTRESRIIQDHDLNNSDGLGHQSITSAAKVAGPYRPALELCLLAPDDEITLFMDLIQDLDEKIAY